MIVKREKKVIVTGASGFLGFNLCNALTAAGHQVLAIDRVANPNKSDKIEFIEGNISELNWRPIMEWCPDEIVHLAGSASVAESYRDVHREVNNSVLLTSFIIEKIRQLRDTKLFFVSSAAVYGNHSVRKYHEDLKCDPISPYGVCKLASEHLIRVSAAEFGFEYTIVRPFSIYGHGLRKQVIYDLTMRFLNEANQLVITGTGMERRDFSHVNDCCAIMVALLEQPSWTNTTFNIGTGEGVSLKKIVELLHKFTGARHGYRFTGKDQPGNPVNLVASMGRLNSHGIACSIGIEEGLRDTVSKIMAEYFDTSDGKATR